MYDPFLFPCSVSESPSSPSIASPKDVFLTVVDSISPLQEAFFVVCLSGAHRLISCDLIFLGTANHCSAVPRDVFRTAILRNSTSIILVHNHPSGVLTPSDDDIKVTQRFVECGRIIGIPVLDHLIIDSSSFFSLAAHGMFE